jgi:hypothetical protein
VTDLAGASSQVEALLARRLGSEQVAETASWGPSEFRSLRDELRSVGYPRLAADWADWRRSRVEIRELFSLAGRFLVPLPLRDLAVFTPLLQAFADEVPDGLSDGNVGVLAAPSLDRSIATVASGRLFAVCDLVPFADMADAFVVPVRQDDRLVVSIVDARQPEITIEPRSSYDHCSRPALVTFEGAMSQPIVEGQAAEAWWAEIIPAGRLAVAAETSGVLQESCAQAVDYARERRQFGRRIGSFQAIQHLLAGISSKAYTLDALCEEAASCAPEAADALATSAKVYASEVGLEVIEGALQVHGAIGYTQERSLHLYLKRVITLAATLGAPRELRRSIGAQRLATARNRP